MATLETLAATDEDQPAESAHRAEEETMTMGRIVMWSSEG